MNEDENPLSFYVKQLSETRQLSISEIVAGIVVSFLLMGASTFGLLFYVASLTPISFAMDQIIRYTLYLVVGLAAATVIGIVICYVMYKRPRTITPLLKVHSYLKRGTGEYFVCPELVDQSWDTVIKRSLYGSILVVGIALTILSFDLMGTATEGDILLFGTYVMIASIVVLPITVMQLYFAPWVIKDSGLFHLDVRDRSLSNVGDDLEDLLEFVAGIDIVLVWIELTINTELWVAPFVILVMIGPLFSIMLNFTLVFMAVKNRAVLAMIQLLIERYGVPDMVKSPSYIRGRVLSLVESRMLAERAVEAAQAAAASLTPTGEAQTPVESLIEQYEDARREVAESGERAIRDARESLAESAEANEEQTVRVLKSSTTQEDGESSPDAEEKDP